MATRRRRTVRRRSNPGRRSMLLVNPRRRRRRTTRRRGTTRRRNSLVVRARNPRRRTRRAASRRRNPTRRRTTRRAVARRRNPTRRRRTYRARRRNPRRRRAAPKVVYRYRTRNPRRRRRNGRRRRNPTFASQLRRFPVIGPILSSVVGFAPQAVFGALSVEPTMWAAKMLAPFVPMVPASLFYPLTGLLVATAVSFLPSGLVSAAMKKQLAVAVASAAGGVGYYKMRTGADAEMAAEAGMLELRGVGGLGSILTVRPQLAGPGYGYAYNPVHYADGLAYQVRPF